MKNHIIKIKDLIGSSNAIIQKMGIQVFETASDYVSQGYTVTLDFSGIENLTSGFCNASIGQLYSTYPKAKEFLQFENLTQNSIWLEKINDSINQSANREQSSIINEAVLSLFDN
jgi:hypothetical protein